MTKLQVKLSPWKEDFHFVGDEELHGYISSYLFVGEFFLYENPEIGEWELVLETANDSQFFYIGKYALTEAKNLAEAIISDIIIKIVESVTTSAVGNDYMEGVAAGIEQGLRAMEKQADNYYDVKGYYSKVTDLVEDEGGNTFVDEREQLTFYNPVGKQGVSNVQALFGIRELNQNSANMMAISYMLNDMMKEDGSLYRYRQSDFTLGDIQGRYSIELDKGKSIEEIKEDCFKLGVKAAKESEDPKYEDYK